ncbi:MAG: hypothetical protein ACI8RZ_000014 [Myxococcota bacterium]|jgi:hypothetical protein
MQVTGRPAHWARDMAIVGGVTASLAPLPALALGATAAFIGGTAVTGAVTGAALGAVMPGVLERVRGRLPLPVLMVLGPIPGALWGGIVGAVGFALSGVGVPLALCVLCAALAGAVQFGLFWFPYTFQTVRGARRWPVVLGACAVTPMIGLLTVAIVLTTVLGFPGSLM